MPGRIPDRKSFGRREPPPNYPKDPDEYADPQNYMYPLDKPIRAKLARRYFDELRNRSKYDEQERLFIDSRIDEALKRFGITTEDLQSPLPPRIDGRKPASRISKKQVDGLSLDDLLQRLLGAARFERAKSIPDHQVSLSSLSGDLISGKVKQYSVQIDLKNRLIEHDCDDWKKHSKSKLMCKHLGKVFLTLGDAKATAILRGVLSEIERWTFSAR